MSSPSNNNSSSSASSSCANSNKRPRLDAPQEGQQKQRQQLDLLALPSEVFLRIVSFSDSAAHLEQALTCQRTREEIETYSKQVYEKIKQEHAVDDTFEERVCDPTNLHQTTTGPKPVSIPYRYRKIVARGKPLYSTVLGGGSIRRNKMVLSPSEDRIAVLDNAREHVLIFDLSTKEQVATINHPDSGSPFRNVVLLRDDNRAVTRCTRSGLRIWTESELGDWRSKFFSTAIHCCQASLWCL